MSTPEHCFFIPKARQAEMLDIPVTEIIAVPHGKTGGTNHWCFYVATSDKSSVRIDCQPSFTDPSTVLEGGYKAMLVISELPYIASNDAQAKFDLTVAADLKVKDIFDTIIEHNHHKYEFDANGVGCRYWTSTTIDLLKDNNIVANATEAAAAKAGILLLWPDKTPLPLDQGAYYE